MDHDQNAVRRPRRRAPKAAAAAVLPLVAAVIVGGCEMPRAPKLPSLPDLPAVPGVYRIDIQQGNVVDDASLDQIEIGMERRKVRFILGTPLLVDPFNQDRWDYFYSLRRGSGTEVTQRLTLHFVDDRLARVENHLRPEAMPGLPVERTPTRVKVPKRRRRPGIFVRGDLRKTRAGRSGGGGRTVR